MPAAQQVGGLDYQRRDLMKGDFSRFTFDQSKHYNGVLMQQGRVQLDADWNELVEIVSHRLDIQAADLIGTSGAPKSDPGFELAARSGLGFDGRENFIAVSQVVEVGLAGVSAWTIEAWIEPKRGGGGGALFSLSGYCTVTIEIDGRICVRPDASAMVPTSGPSDAQIEPLYSAVAVPFGERSHVAVSCDSRGRRIYVNGVVAAEDTRGMVPLGESATLMIGASGTLDTRSAHYAGVIESFRVWSKARDAAAVRDAMELDPSDDEEDLVGFWNFAEGAGSTVRDRSRFANDCNLGHGFRGGRQPWVHGIRIGRGRYYVDGLLCRNDESVALDDRWGLPPELAKNEWAREPGYYMAYIDAWERLVVAAQDPGIREVALGGADTMARLQTAWQVRLLPVSGPEQVDSREKRLRMLHAMRPHSRMRAQRAATTATLDNTLYRVEVHDAGGAYGWPRHAAPGVTPTRVVNVDASARRVVTEEWIVDGVPWRPGQLLELYSAQTDEQKRPGVLVRIDAANAEDRALTLDQFPAEMVGNTGLRLRRVATFKWARDNAAIALPITPMQHGSALVNVRHSAADTLPINPADWVEICDDATEINHIAQPLYKVIDIDRSYMQLTLDRASDSPIGKDAARHPLVRRWSQSGRGTASGSAELVGGALLLTEGLWHDLESGVQVTFEAGGSYRSGDYWMIPARSITEDIEWPRDGNSPKAMIPHGVRHVYEPIALVHLRGNRTQIEDLRTIFSPLSGGYLSTTGGSISGSLHVEKNLEVDGHVRLRGNLDAGLVSGTLADSIVGTRQLAARSVTPHKLAYEVIESLVPVGAMILSESMVPPVGYENTGLALPVAHPDPHWHRVTAIPSDTAEWFNAVVVGPKVYCFLASGETWEYDILKNWWLPKCEMPAPRRGFGAATINGLVYVVGGQYQHGAESGRLDVYDPQSDTWSTLAEMPTARRSPAVAVAGGKLYVIGGERRAWYGQRSVRANEMFDPETNSWFHCKPMKRARAAFGVAESHGGIYAIGGSRRWFFFFTRALRTNHMYDPGVNQWVRRRPMPTARYDGGVCTVNNHVYAIGGHGRHGIVGTSEEYEPDADKWVRRTPLPVPRRDLVVRDMHGRILVMGGVTPNGRTNGFEETALMARLYVHKRGEYGRAEYLLEE